MRLLSTTAPWPTATAPPIPTITPLPPPATAAPEGPVILYFRANVEEADPGDTIVLEWASTGGSRATLYALLPSGTLPLGWPVAPTGTYTYTIPLYYRNGSLFRLYVFDQAEHWSEAALTVRLRCPDPWFFSPAPEICGTQPVFSRGAEQHFEHGVMIWIEALDKIVILYDEPSPQWGGRWGMVDDEWAEGLPEYDPALVPPAGFYQPVRGFGLVWRSGVRERLGWAIDQETGFDTAFQMTTLYKYNSTYIRALDGNVWCLWPEVSGWEKIQVTAS